MNTRLIGIILIVLGATALAFEGYAYTTQEPVANADPKFTGVDPDGPIPVRPMLGIGALVGGVWFLSRARPLAPRRHPSSRLA